jgi:thioredoxin 1
MADGEFAVWNEQNFDAEVLRQPGLAVVDFWTENCVPCKQLARALAQLSAEIPAGVRIGTIKVNDNPDLAARYGVQASPTLLFFKDGALVDTRTGVDRRQVLKKLVETHA